jgi:phage terminase large subunit-like protein/uncharacterized protein with PIN domain
MPRGVAMTPEQKAAAAERLARGRATAQANRERNKLLGIKKPLTPKQRERMRTMNAVRKAKEAAVNEAVTVALSPVAVMGPDHARRDRKVNLVPLTPQQAAANARAAKQVKAASENVTAPVSAPTAAMSVDDRLAYYRLKLENKFALFRPYPTQMEFFALTAEHREAMLRAANQYGKTTGGAYMGTCFASGRYPDWWPGRRFSRPTLGWVGGLSGVAVRDAAQTKLLGMPGDPSSIGTAMVPKDLIVPGSINASRSAPNGVDAFLVKHVSGGNSRIVFKTYEQGAGFWQGPTVDWIWMDEECPPDVLNEALARLTGDGCLFITLSPLLGRSLVYMRYNGDLTAEQRRDRGVVVAALAEAEHFSEEEKNKRRASFSEAERPAREFGDATMGEGSVFTTPEADLRINLSLSRVPNEWRKIWGLDFGSNHPFGAVLWAFDLENDVDYILHCIKMTTPPNTPAILGHCDAIKRIGALVPVAWPHDGHVQREGEALKDLYKSHGLKMLETHALNASGNHYTQPGIDGLDERMQERKLFVRNSPENEKWFEEYRAYHRKDNKIVKDFDDLMSATRIGFIMKHRARPVALGGPEAEQRRRPPIREFDLFSGLPIEPRAA